jgi:hypothetical protein
MTDGDYLAPTTSVLLHLLDGVTLHPSSDCAGHSAAAPCWMVVAVVSTDIPSLEALRKYQK